MNNNRHPKSGQFTDQSGASKATDSVHAVVARKHVKRLQAMSPTPKNVTTETNRMHQEVMTIPSGAFFQNGQM